MSPWVFKGMATSFACASIVLAIAQPHCQHVVSSSRAENWIANRTSESCPSNEQVKVDNRLIVEIDPAHRDMAIRDLEKESAIVLSQDQYNEFARHGQPGFTLLANVRPYLVRAVSAAPANRAFSVHWCHHELFVFSGSLGGNKPQKDPFIVFLDRQPESVVLSYAMAE